MPLFSWRKRPHVEAARGGALLRELLWQVEERERRRNLVRGVQPPAPHPLVAPHEREQLELLCAQVQPTHTAAVLARVKEVLASSNLLPWELVCVFQQVLKDFLCREEEEEAGPEVARVHHCQVKLSSTTAMTPDYSEPQREEIPTISSHVDRSMRWARPYAAQRDWDLPYYYPTPYHCSQTYSTTR